MEDGLIAEQSSERFTPSLESDLDFLSLPLFIKAHVLDQNQRTAGRAEQEGYVLHQAVTEWRVPAERD